MAPTRRPRAGAAFQAILALIILISLSSCGGKPTVSVVPNPNVSVDTAGDPHVWYVATTGDDQANTCHHPASPCLTVQAVIDRAASGDEVHIAKGVYSGRVEISKLDLTIEGSGPDTILEIPTPEGEPAWGGGVLYIHCDWCSNSVRISNLTVRNGTAGNGGGIFIQRMGLTLENVMLRDSSASMGGCLFVYAETTATLNGVTFEGCQATDGAGIFNNGTLIASATFLRNNAAGDRGGGMFNGLDATATLTGNWLEGNSAGQLGGGILNYGDLTVSASTFRSNQPDGVFNYGTARILTSTLQGHLGLYDAALQNGGYMYAYNVTVSGNEGAGIRSHGEGSSLQATSLTIADNQGAGLDRIAEAGTLYMASSVLSNNGAFIASNVGGKANCGAPFPISGTHNLSSDDTCAFAAPGNTAGVDPMLGPLQDNGGPTWTHELLPGSPAIDSGAGLSYNATLTDQRGMPRPIDGDDDGMAWNDIGAFEADPKASVQAMLDVLLQTPLPPPRLFTPNEPSNCRQGPGVVYPATDSLPGGVAFLVEGRNEIGDWLRLMASRDVSCWVKADLGILDGEPTGMLVLEAPPTPRPTVPGGSSVVCSSFKTEGQCGNRPSECKWVKEITGAGTCKSR